MTDNLELEKTLWQAADKLRNNMDAAEYKHVVLGLIFLKYISDAFDELFNQLVAEKNETGADPEDKDEYTAERVFYVPPSARWKWLQGRAKLPTVGRDIDDAMDSIEKDNPTLKGVLPKDLELEELQYNRASSKDDKDAEIYKFYINSLYVAITRAVKNIYLFETQVNHPILQLLHLQESKREIQVSESKSSQEFWQCRIHSDCEHRSRQNLEHRYRLIA